MKIFLFGVACAVSAFASITPAAAADAIGVVAVAEPPGPTAELAELTHQLRVVTAERTAGVVAANELRERMTGQTSSATLAELDRAHAGALATYQNGDFEGAVRTLRAVVHDLERLPPSSEAFSQWTRAMLRLARAEQTLGRGGEAREALERLVRANPAVKADPNQYPPSFVKQVEETAAQVRALVKRKLAVSATTKSATIFVEGREVGTAPMTVELPPGRYRVSGAHGNVYVPAVVVDLNEEGQSVTLNFALAESLRPGFGPGLALAEADRARNLVSAGNWLGVDKLLATRLVTESGVEYLAATFFDVRRGMLLREGRVRLANKVAPAGTLSALASFLITGQTSELVSAVDPARPPKPPGPPIVNPEPLADTTSSSMPRRRYVEAQVGYGPSNPPVTKAGTVGVVALALKAGMVWTPEWAFELGVGYRGGEANDFGVHHGEQWNYSGRTDLNAVYGSAGAAWSPRGNRYFAIAGDIGLAHVSYVYDEEMFSGAPFMPAHAESAKASGWGPRLGAELRLDYPMRSVTFGARLGVAALRSGARGTTTWPASNSDWSFWVPERTQYTWLEPGWIIEFPLSATVRYAF